MACHETAVGQGNIEVPVGTITVNVERRAREAFFEQIKNFGGKHGFAVRIAPIRPDNEHFTVELWRSDLKVLGDNPFDQIDPAQFRISFYQNGQHPVPARLLEFVVNDLKRFIAEVPGTTFASSTN